MSYLDPSRPPEERIQQAIIHGPDMEAGGRFGAITRFARKLVGRAVKYERDFNLQVDVALLDKVHESEMELKAAETRLSGTDDNLRDADEDLREIDRRQQREIAALVDRFDTFEARSTVCGHVWMTSSGAPVLRARSRPARPSGWRSCTTR